MKKKRLNKDADYKLGINSLITAAELGLSGGSLLGAYANYKNWATAANASKRTIANLLQKAQAPMQLSGTLIDGYQTLDAINNKDEFNKYKIIEKSIQIAKDYADKALSAVSNTELKEVVNAMINRKF